MKLECGHDGEDGLVCAACLKEAGGLEAGYLEALDRLGLVRRLAVMKSTKLVHEGEEPEDEDQTAASEDWADHMGRQPGGGAR